MANQLTKDEKPFDALGNSGTNQCLFYVFSIGGIEYALGAHNVIEIRDPEPVIPVGNAPAFVRGVIPLGGALVPVVDLRTLLGAQGEEPSASSSVVVTNLHGGTIALIVDTVSGLTALQPDETRPLRDIALGDGIFLPRQRKPRNSKVAVPVLH
ncbi:MAG: chemotaxis protein CheW [Betaproteobacteria bacterium]|nr:chemotaxis protein CheW [Betaproteobacteria bacterium]